MSGAQQLAVTATCLVAAVTYAGAVTTLALLSFVLPGVAIAAFAAAWLATRHRLRAALLAGPLVILGWAELVNVWSGETQGPAARSSFAAGVGSLLTVVAANSRWPGLFLAPLCGTVFGALALGAGGEVRSVAVAVAVCAVVTLGWIGQSQHKWNARPRYGATLVLLPLVAGVAAVGAVVLQKENDSRPPLIIAHGQVDPSVRPAWGDPLTKISKAARRRPPVSVPATSDSEGARGAPARTGSSPSQTWLTMFAAIAVLTVTLVLLALARRLAVQFAWRKVRRRLASGTPTAQISGAWVWARMRLDACRLPLAANVSPDIFMAGHATHDLAPEVVTPLRSLAAAATSAAFSHQRSTTAADVDAAWTAAKRTEAAARQFLTKRGRLRLAFRRPTPVRAGSGAAPGLRTLG
jgi:hypothetical protein